MASSTRSRTKRAPKAAPAGPGLPVTAAELDALQGEARQQAEHERSSIMQDAVAAAGTDDLPKLGGVLPESETGPLAAPAKRVNPDPQQAAVEEAVAAIDWVEVWTPKGAGT